MCRSTTRCILSNLLIFMTFLHDFTSLRFDQQVKLKIPNWMIWRLGLLRYTRIFGEPNMAMLRIRIVIRYAHIRISMNTKHYLVTVPLKLPTNHFNWLHMSHYLLNGALHLHVLIPEWFVYTYWFSAIYDHWYGSIILTYFIIF